MDQKSGTLYRYSGTGNTFVLVDNRGGLIRDAGKTAKALCAEFGVDGLLLAEKSFKAAVRMRIVNPDSSEVAMCGNGSRCLAHWAHHEAKLPADFDIETGAGILRASVRGDVAKIRLTDPKDLKEIKGLDIPEAVGAIRFINTGVEHTVVEVADVSKVDIEKRGNFVRYHDLFKPAGTNACFYQALGNDRIRARVYERGVESETQSCGTGSTACALIASLKHGYVSPIKVEVTSGEVLNIYFSKQWDSFKDVYLEGKVQSLGKEAFSS